ncbi:MAG: formate dehydrogenase accessory sulfurtransferase FdhD [Deltaproteobacteria bacterium]|nr:formate dehydrogenase accessory sulfurtransferase FdhD [Deltaproteobacteria bacterium]
MGATRAVELLRLEDGRLDPHHDEVAAEEPLEIRVDGEPLSVVMRTPGHDAELALGLLVSEGIVRRAEDIGEIEHCAEEEADNVVNVVLSSSADRRGIESARRLLVTSSSCGLCGKTTLESLSLKHARFDDVPELDVGTLAKLPEQLARLQPGFLRSGGLHAAAIFDEAHARIVAREDVGRHNAVDKCVGALVLTELLPVPRATLVVSGRVSFEIVQKAIAARIQTVVAVSAPSSLAVEVARAMNLGLVAFARGDRANLYSGRARPHRDFAAPQPW